MTVVASCPGRPGSRRRLVVGAADDVAGIILNPTQRVVL